MNQKFLSKRISFDKEEETNQRRFASMSEESSNYNEI